MVVDYERAWLLLKASIAEKGSHGKRDLLVTMAECEVACATDDDRYDPGPLRRIGRKKHTAA